MKSFKFKFDKRIFIISISIIAILVCAIVYAVVQTDISARLFKTQPAEVLSNADGAVVAIVDGEKITKKGFDSYKLLINSGGNKLSDQQILDKIIDRQIIYKQAIKENLVASDKEVALAINTAQDTIKAVKQDYESFKEYIRGLNKSEDGYWKIVEPAYKKSLSCGKYKQSLKQKFEKDRKIKDNTKFEEFYNKKINELKSKAEIISYLK